MLVNIKPDGISHFPWKSFEAYFMLCADMLLDKPFQFQLTDGNPPIATFVDVQQALFCRGSKSIHVVTGQVFPVESVDNTIYR